MRLAITGAGGRLGTALCGELMAAGHQVEALRHADLDITRADQVGRLMRRLRPNAIINCSAYNAVDAAESDAVTAFAVNARGPALLRDAADAVGATLVHYSTDFVFDGNATAPYTEADPTNPLSIYGASKLAGEMHVGRGRRCYVLRVESLFGGSCTTAPRSTVDWIAANLVAGLTVRVFVDRTVSPSYVPDVARSTIALLERGAPYGTYHCVNSGHATWDTLADEMATLLRVEARLERVRSTDLTSPASRPRFCALSNRKLSSVAGAMPHWRSAMRDHLAKRHGAMIVPAAAVS
jgi:dTDP-4-dehydrorhamnose reductase